ncbi:MAG: nucleotidyl transferase AbiEii/AbiGii toxin family protein [Myxococcaceae bacterium]
MSEETRERTVAGEQEEGVKRPPPPAMQPDQRPAMERGAHLLAISSLKNAEIPFVVAGAYALHLYTGIYRETKDLDLFLKREHVDRALETLSEVGFRTEMSNPVWIAKAHASDDYFADLIFSSGNGVAVVDDLWIERASPGVVHGTPILVAPPEEIIWSKAFVCERERFDGADINHLILARGKQMDWKHLLWRFGSHWEVLLAHLVFYRFSYPGQRDHVPDWVWMDLMERARNLENVPSQKRYCRGMLIAKGQYRVDVEHWGYVDARLEEVEGFRAYTEEPQLG